jgi:hypothetical protein
LPPFSTKWWSIRILLIVALFEINKRGFFRMVAVALLALCASFTFPESHYTFDKTFIKTPAPYTEISSLLCDDVEDANDLSTEIHFFQSPTPVLAWHSVKEVMSAVAISAAPRRTYRQVFLRHRQILI